MEAVCEGEPIENERLFKVGIEDEERMCTKVLHSFFILTPVLFLLFFS